MSLQRCLLALLSVVFVTTVGAGPAVESQDGRFRIRGLASGERVAWAALVREPVGTIAKVYVVSGVGQVGGDGELAVQEQIPAKADVLRWMVAPFGGNEAAQGKLRAGANSDTDPKEIVVAVVGDNIEVQAAAVDITYIRADGERSFFYGADGGQRDLDGLQNGTIVVPRTSLSPVANEHIPTSFQSGDKIILFDLYEWRGTKLEVGR
ncbi:MAG: hypothetical protein JOZ54_23375 [Acidobacteria bacterium]|nr:hypothetical protein [Acidobacteriota bacterium]